MVKKNSPVIPVPVVEKVLDEKEQIQDEKVLKPEQIPEKKKSEKKPRVPKTSEKKSGSSENSSSPEKKKSPAVKAVNLNHFFDTLSGILLENEIVKEIPDNLDLISGLKENGFSLRDLYNIPDDIEDDALLPYHKIIIEECIFPRPKKTSPTKLLCAYNCTNNTQCKNPSSKSKMTELGYVVMVCANHSRSVKPIPKDRICQDALDNPDKYKPEPEKTE